MVEVNKIIKDIQNKKFSPIYFLMGDEPYFIDKINDVLLENVLTEDEKSFNLDILYGKDSTAEQVISIAKQFPLMADYRLVIVKEAQDLPDIENLALYLPAMQMQTILVLNYKYKKLDKRKDLYKKLVEYKAIVLTFDRIKENQIYSYINQLVTSKNRTIDTKSTYLLAEFLGTDLSKIDNEINKLCILVPESSEITDEIIEKNIGISKDYNNFELVKAIANKDAVKAIRIINYFSDNIKNNPPVVTISVLYNFFSLLLQHHGVIHKNKKMPIDAVATQLKKSAWALQDTAQAVKLYSMKDVSRNIQILKELDLRTKGVNAANLPYRYAMTEFLMKIFQ